MRSDFHLGPWTVEPASNTLRLGDEARRLSLKAMSALVLLAEEPRRVVAKDEMIERVWEGRFTSDEVLTTVIYELRKALDDNARRPTYIETIRKRGYRLIAPVTPCVPAAQAVADRAPKDRAPKGWRWPRLGLATASAAAALLTALLTTAWLLPGEAPPAGGERTTTPQAVGPVLTSAAPLPAPSVEVDPAVGEAFQMGSHFLRQGTARGNGRAEAYFSRAIELSPAFAPAHVGLADALIAQAGEQEGPAQFDHFRQARVAAETALALDGNLPTAHLALASVYFRHEWDWLGADRHFRLGYEPKVCPVEGSRHYAAYLSAVGRHDEAIAALERSLARDPASKTGRWSLAWSYYLARQYDAALVELNRVRELDPSYLPIFQLESDVFLASSLEEQAFFAYQRIVELSGDSSEEVASVASVYAQGGIEGVLRHLVGRALQRSTEVSVDPVLLASYEARLGAENAALDWLDRAYASRDHGLVWIDVDPAFDSIRRSERFRQILANLGLYSPS
ncbi:MAG: winged helix-turn-helix domain-containing protein [Acidobacteriota bacterium]